MRHAGIAAGAEPRLRHFRALTLALIGLALTVNGAPTVADVVHYECDTDPVTAGWSLFQSFCGPQESIVGGWLVHSVAPCAGSPPPGGQQLDYSRVLDEFQTTPSFYLQWRMRSSGDRSEISWGGPSKIVLASFGPTNYRFSIARDLVELNRDNLLPIFQVEISEETAHTFRLELPNESTYLWFVDNQLVNSGVSQGPYPADQPFITLRAKSAFLASTNQWDYIRYGTIPQPASGDFDSSGTVDANDVYFFLDCLLGPDASGPGCRWADMNNDGTVNGDDVQLFAAALLGP